jgi:hypothetical protein
MVLGQGEWMVNPTKDYQTYNPLGKDESDRCVSVVNGMGSDRSDFAALDGGNWSLWPGRFNRSNARLSRDHKQPNLLEQSTNSSHINGARQETRQC